MRKPFAGRDVRVELQLALKMTVASALAWWVCTLLGEPRPLFAAYVPLVTMSADPFSAINISIGRVLGVFAGVGIGLAAIHLPMDLVLQATFAVAAGTFIGIGLRLGGRPNVQAAVSALFIIALDRGKIGHVAVARIWETALGAGATIVVATVLLPADPVRELRQRLERLRSALKEDLDAAAEDLIHATGATSRVIDDVRAHSLEAVRDYFELDRAKGALRWNPLRRSDAKRFGVIEARIRLAARLYRHARSLMRDVAESAPICGTETGIALGTAAGSLADGIDVTLRGEAEDGWLGPITAMLDTPAEGDAFIVQTRLRRMVADVETLS